MKVEDLISHLKDLKPSLEICTCDINGDVEKVEGFSDRERVAHLVREPKPWNGGQDYYEYWTLNPKGKEALDQKEVFIIW